MKNESEKSFLDVQKEAMEVRGFWTEEYRSTIVKNTELMYNTDIIREWQISDLILTGDKVLIKWIKRIIPFTKQQLKEQYGR